MATKTTRKRTTTTAKKRPKLDTGGRPASKGGKGGTVTQHGVTTTGYQRGCRCDECKAAMAEARRKERERKAATTEAAKPATNTATKTVKPTGTTAKKAVKPTSRRRTTKAKATS